MSFSFAPDGSLAARRGGGGLVSGLMPGLAAVAADGGVLWLCAALSDADRVAARLGERAHGAPGEAPVRMLDIPQDTFAAAYNGIANSVLWFVHHLLFDTPIKPRFDAAFRRDWAAYVAYNQAFADALAEESVTGTRVLVQDYHLALAPRMLRDLRPGTRIAHFEHTPWAPPDYYRLLPDDIAAAVLDGMLGADHPGFHSQRWAAAFLDCCEAVLGARGVRVSRSGAGGEVSYRGRVTGVADAPARRGRRGAARPRPGGRRADGGSRTVRSGGRAAGHRPHRPHGAVQEHPARPGRLPRAAGHQAAVGAARSVHLALAYPSRSGLAEYRAYTERVHDLAQEINAEFGTDDWDPLILDLKDDYPVRSPPAGSPT